MNAPLVPSDIDLRDFSFMPLKIERLQKSKSWLQCKKQPELAFYLLNLWMRAWHEVPAGSIEDDDDVLADAAMCPMPRWLKIREQVLRNWEKRNGRLFHATVTEIAAESWQSKIKQRNRTVAARAAKLSRLPTETVTEDVTGFVTSAATMNVTDNVTSSVTDNVTASKGREGKGEERDKKGKGQESSSTNWESQPRRTGELLEFRKNIVQAFEASNNPNIPDTSRAELWIEWGYKPAICLAVIADVLARKNDIGTLSYFDAPIAKAHDRAKNNGAGDKPADPDEERTKWRRWWDFYRRTGTWPASWGPDPDSAGCEIPRQLIEKWSNEATEEPNARGNSGEGKNDGAVGGPDR